MRRATVQWIRRGSYPVLYSQVRLYEGKRLVEKRVTREVTEALSIVRAWMEGKLDIEAAERCGG